jgi:hypothetical protein
VAERASRTSHAASQSAADKGQGRGVPSSAGCLYELLLRPAAAALLAVGHRRLRAVSRRATGQVRQPARGRGGLTVPVRLCLGRCGRRVTDASYCPRCAPRSASSRAAHTPAYRKARARLARTVTASTPCGICGEPLGTGGWDADHLVPVAAGGAPGGELRATHPKCNRGRASGPRAEPVEPEDRPPLIG